MMLYRSSATLRTSSVRALRSRSLVSTPSSAPSPPPPRTAPSRLAKHWQPHLDRLRREYPHVDPPSLVVAFLALHELTALVPLVALFALFRYLALGSTLVAWVLAQATDLDASAEDQKDPVATATSGWRATALAWLVEAEDKAERVGRRYGWFGWDQETAEQRQERRAEQSTVSPERSVDELRVSGDVANAAAAYLAVKALIPLRILVSLRLSPSLANVIVRNFRGLRERGRRYVARSAPAGPEVLNESGGKAR